MSYRNFIKKTIIFIDTFTENLDKTEGIRKKYLTNYDLIIFFFSKDIEVRKLKLKNNYCSIYFSYETSI